LGAEASVKFSACETLQAGGFKGSTRDEVDSYFASAWYAINERDGTARALRDYDAHDLSVRTGDAVEVIEKESGWDRGRNPSGAIGWVPFACVTSEA
jgi:SH3-like domain-containing protein